MRSRRIPAAQACEWGIATEQVADADLEAATNALVDELRAFSPIAQRTAKKMLNDTEDATLSIAIELEGHCYSRLRQSDDFREGVEAFHADGFVVGDLRCRRMLFVFGQHRQDRTGHGIAGNVDVQFRFRIAERVIPAAPFRVSTAIRGQLFEGGTHGFEGNDFARIADPAHARRVLARVRADIEDQVDAVALQQLDAAAEIVIRIAYPHHRIAATQQEVAERHVEGFEEGHVSDSSEMDF